MKSQFENLYNKYKLLLEQPETAEVPAPNAPVAPQVPVATPDQAVSPASQTQQPPQATQASTGYAVLVQLMVDAFKTLNVRHPEDIKFSDNIARTPQQAYQYLEIVKRNLENDLQNKTQEDVGKGGNDSKNVDSADIINIANLAIKALFFRPKDVQSSEYNDIASIPKVTVDNAKQIYDNIRNILSER